MTHVLVVTTVHHPLDTRIYYREIGTLLRAGARVTYAAPWADCSVAIPDTVEGVTLPRSVGRRRLGAMLAARRVVRRLAGSVDAVLIHDPELVAATWGVRGARERVIWDVHELGPESTLYKAWIPSFLRPAAARVIGWLESRGAARYRTILAEDGYRERFPDALAVVPNYPILPDTFSKQHDARIVYAGNVTRARGGRELIELARRLKGSVGFDVIGSAEEELREDLLRAQRDGLLTWHGRVPWKEVGPRVDGALAGLCLLADTPNYTVSLPTKALEYMSYGVPYIATALPRLTALAAEEDCGFVVPFDDAVEGAAQVVERLAGSDALRAEVGAQARAACERTYGWQAVEGALLGALGVEAKPGEAS
jgi:glycosyltransferase involved in cell wall biosynthesis